MKKYKNFKEDCSLGFHDFQVPPEQYDWNVWLVYAVCSRCGITRGAYENELRENGDDFRVRYERKSAVCKNLFNLLFALSVYAILIYSILSTNK